MVWPNGRIWFRNHTRLLLSRVSVPSCYHVDMKTITLTQEAYDRLVDWKQDAKETFSQVVLKVVPRRGTAAHLLEVMEQMPPLTEDEFQKITEIYEIHRTSANYESNENQWTR